MEKVYRDVPIPPAGRKITAREGQGQCTDPDQDNVPERIRTLMKMMTPYQYEPKQKAKAFLEQARFMEDYEDSFPLQGFVNTCAVPAYQDLPACKLRAYFSWRTQVRRKERPGGNGTYLLIYLSELVNGIGADTPEDGFQKLLRLQADYAGTEGWPSMHAEWWLKDYIIVNNMDKETAEAYFGKEIMRDVHLIALADSEEADDRSLKEAIFQNREYAVSRSAFVKKYPNDAAACLTAVYRAASHFLRLHPFDAKNELSAAWYTECPETCRKGDIADLLLGELQTWPSDLFTGLLYVNHVPDGFRYEVDPVRVYEFRKGECICQSRIAFEGSMLGEFLRETDRQMRLAFGFGHALKARLPERLSVLEPVIRQAVADYLEEKKHPKAAPVQVDKSKLSGIRSAADYTRDRLLEGTREETQSDVLEDPPEAGKYLPKETLAPDAEKLAEPKAVLLPDAEKLPEPEEVLPQPCKSGLTKQEYEFLNLILNKKSWKEYIFQNHLMVSVIADSINEKLYDEIGDVVIGMDGDTPELVEDYRPELEALFPY